MLHASIMPTVSVELWNAARQLRKEFPELRSTSSGNRGSIATNGNNNFGTALLETREYKQMTEKEMAEMRTHVVEMAQEEERVGDEGRVKDDPAGLYHVGDNPGFVQDGSSAVIDKIYDQAEKERYEEFLVYSKTFN
jgi:hypothetical protein